GSYFDLLDPQLRRILDQAAKEPKLPDEIGGIRIALARLLVEETGPSKLAVDAQLASFQSSLDEEAFLTLRFPAPPVHTALELIARAQVGDEAFEEMMAAIYDGEEEEDAEQDS